MKSKKNGKGVDTMALNLDNFKFTNKIIPLTEEEEKSLSEKMYEIDGNILFAHWKNRKLHGNVKILYKNGHLFEGKY